MLVCGYVGFVGPALPKQRPVARGSIAMIYAVIVAGLAIASAISTSAQGPTVTGPAEQMLSFSPLTGKDLVRGTSIRMSADVALVPSSSDTVEYVSKLTVNRRVYRSFETVLLPPAPLSRESVNETLTWFVHIVGPKKMTVRLQLTGKGSAPRTSFIFSDTERTYRIICNPHTFWPIRKLQEVFGVCWSM